MCGAARGGSFSTDYQLRIISPDAIGRDVNVPPLTISYRVHSRVGAAATLEGRDLSYLMPTMPIKVLSLVPADAADIRDGSEASLAPSTRCGSGRACSGSSRWRSARSPR